MRGKIVASSRKGNLVLTCEHCGGSKEYDMPGSNEVILRFAKALEKEHTDCKKDSGRKLGKPKK